MKDSKREVLKVDMGADGSKSIKVEFPSNSRKDKEEKNETKKVQKVVKGKVLKKKKSLGKKFMQTFVGEDIDNVWEYLVHDVLVPAAKSTVSDMVQGGIEMLLFGERKGSRTTRDKGRSYVSYNNYGSRDRDRDRDRDRERSSRNRSKHSFDDIVLSSRGEAEEVLSHLVDLTIDYGQATIADLYDLVGITQEYTDRKYGWTDLGGASVSREREGYVLNLPKPRVVD